MIGAIREKYQQLQERNGNSPLTSMEQNAFEAFNRLGIPTVRHEEWKYTRISGLLNKEYSVGAPPADALTPADLESYRLPGSDDANELVFVNGIYQPGRSVIRSADLSIQSLQEAAAGTHKERVAKHLGHSDNYLRDGIHALNTAFVQEGIYIHLDRKKVLEHPIYIYHFTDARASNILAQPRLLMYVSEQAEIQIVETFHTIGLGESFTNGVMEVVVEAGAMVEYYKIQNDEAHTAQVSTTHFHQIGRSHVHAVTLSLNGSVVRNNLNIAMDADGAEAHLYGLYFIKGHTHVDNHTVVDNRQPHLQSNELYKGVVDDSATAVFNGKIYVQPHAQKINAFQSNKNILMSDTASVNTKPQLEIFADDVKCSHGCTVGQLDEEGLFYLRSRGISEKMALSLLVHAFAIDILEHIKLASIRTYVDDIISERLDFDAV